MHVDLYKYSRLLKVTLFLNIDFIPRGLELGWVGYIDLEFGGRVNVVMTR